MICSFFLVYFNKTSILSSKYTHDDIERHCFSRDFFLHFLSVFSPFYTEVWHLWQQKNNIAVGVRAPMRTYAHLRVHARNAPRKFSLHFFPHFLFFLLLLFLFPHSPSLPPSSLLGYPILASSYFAICVVQIWRWAKKKVHISLIFSRFGAISTHIQIGGWIVNPHLFRN